MGAAGTAQTTGSRRADRRPQEGRRGPAGGIEAREEERSPLGSPLLWGMAGEPRPAWGAPAASSRVLGPPGPALRPLRRSRRVDGRCARSSLPSRSLQHRLRGGRHLARLDPGAHVGRLVADHPADLHHRQATAFGRRDPKEPAADPEGRLYLGSGQGSVELSVIVRYPPQRMAQGYT